MTYLDIPSKALYALQAAPWQPPASFEAALHKISGEPAVWLKRAVDIMAFGEIDIDPGIVGPVVTERDGIRMDHPERAARRCQASRELCQAARKGLITLIGNPDQPGDGSSSIPRAYFDTPRISDDNSIISDENKIMDEGTDAEIDAFAKDHFSGHQKWFNVRVETHSLLTWLGRARPTAPCGAVVDGKPVKPDIPISQNRLGTPKQEAVRLALWDKYTDGFVPGYLSINLVTQAIGHFYERRMREMGNPDLGGPSEATVLRVLTG